MGLAHEGTASKGWKAISANPYWHGAGARKIIFIKRKKKLDKQ